MNSNQSIVDQVAAAVLYEGYILYPYRPALKNRQRWTFGGVYPPAYSSAHEGDACSIETECLLQATADAVLDIKVRFLHLVDRTVGELTPPLAEWPLDEEPDYRSVDRLVVAGQVHHSWQEAVERDVALQRISLNELVTSPRREPFAFASQRSLEPLKTTDGTFEAVLVRQQEKLMGIVEIGASCVRGDLFKCTVRIHNETPLLNAEEISRDAALMRSLVSTHTILSVRGGEFISLTDPPHKFREAAESCSNRGAWPVLVGEAGQTDTVLSAPIILYDYPQVAPESPGDLFDATEIDEILSLRVLTLTDDEKRDMGSVEECARELLERTETLSPESFSNMHGTLRRVEPVVGGTER